MCYCCCNGLFNHILFSILTSTGKYHHGKRVVGQWVFGGVERGSNKCFLVAVHDRKKETLLRLIKQWIAPGTIIISDCWAAYNEIW